VLPSTGASLIPDNFNYDGAIQIRKDAIAQLQVKINELNAQVDTVMAYVANNVSCEEMERIMQALQSKLQPIQNLISKASNAISQIQKEINELICRKNFPPGLKLRDCLTGGQSQSNQSAQGQSGSDGGNGANGKDASKLTRAQKLLACQANGANGSRGAAGGK
jgi:ElaB/YqjD/DUF883 family membrane-anchored ribosome-binding protein